MNTNRALQALKDTGCDILLRWKDGKWLVNFDFGGIGFSGLGDTVAEAAKESLLRWARNECCRKYWWVEMVDLVDGLWVVRSRSGRTESRLFFTSACDAVQPDPVGEVIKSWKEAEGPSNVYVPSDLIAAMALHGIRFAKVSEK